MYNVLFVEILFMPRMKYIKKTFPLFLTFTRFHPENGRG